MVVEKNFKSFSVYGIKCNVVLCFPMNDIYIRIPVLLFFSCNIYTFNRKQTPEQTENLFHTPVDTLVKDFE